MSYLFTRYVADHAGNGFLANLTQSSNVGVANIANASSRGFLDWMGDWAATLLLQSEDIALSPYVYTSIDLAGDFAAPASTTLSLEAPSMSGVLPVSGVRYFRLTGTSQASTDLEVSGDVRAIVMRIR